MTQFSVPVHEYCSAKPGGPAYPHLPPFAFNDRQLVIGMVRATLTSNARKPARKLIAAVTWPTLRFMLDWSVVPRLELSSQCHLGVRDFSLTSRVGELAQGVSYVYWHWERGYSWIADFGPWAAGLKPAIALSRAPDFVMLNARTGDLALMEAKGTGAACYKRPMYKALGQCKAGLKHSAFNRGFGSVLTLDQKRALTGRGELHIRDPEMDRYPADKTAYAVFKRSYASWFELAGDDQMAAWCRSDNDAEPIRGIQAPGTVWAKQALVANSVLPSLGFDLRHTRFSLDPAVLEALGSFDAFRKRDWLKELTKGSTAQENMMRFPDGTRIVQE